MANKKFTDLTAAGTITGAEILAMVQGGDSVQGDIDLIKAYFDTLYPTMVYTAPASVTPTLTGFGTVTGLTAYTWRVGAYLHFEYTWTNGTVTATEARASLRYNPGSGEVDVTSASTYPTLQVVGHAASSAGPAAGGTGFGNTIVLAEASKSYVTFGAQIDGIIAGLGKRGGDAFANSAVMSARGAVRIQGW